MFLGMHRWRGSILLRFFVLNTSVLITREGEVDGNKSGAWGWRGFEAEGFTSRVQPSSLSFPCLKVLCELLQYPMVEVR